jgi:hypothetical protein
MSINTVETANVAREVKNTNDRKNAGNKVNPETLNVGKGSSFDVSKVNKSVSDVLAHAGRLKASMPEFKRLDLAGDGSLDAKALSDMVKAGKLTKEVAKKIVAVHKLREAVKALLA